METTTWSAKPQAPNTQTPTLPKTPETLKPCSHTNTLTHTFSITHTLTLSQVVLLRDSHSLTRSPPLSLSLSLSLSHTHSVTALPQVGWTMEEVMPVMNGEEPEKEVIGQDEMVLLLFYYSCA